MYDEVHLPEEEKGIFLIDEQKQEQMDEVEKEKAKNYEVDYEEEILPNFMKKETERSSAAMRGTSYHRIMELIDETKNCLYHTEAIKTYLEGQAKAGKIDSESLAQIDLWKIYHFYQTTLGKRMIQAACLQQLKKEQQFILSLPACEIYPEMHSEESVLIQGIIDAFFEEDGELVLVDYKTDHVKTKDELIRKYRAQFHYYQVALEQITGKRVKESFLYSFALGEALPISIEKED
jgi:ATP-dependent helicase/nuclease subunit A